ncbi:MAG TPA: VWA domain-containing protein [Bryobacteraceae bacterium]|jgi:VWFA-related protein|nr:VWA domain-containing protein [Bryobacteraceae bacterium]
MISRREWLAGMVSAAMTRAQEQTPPKITADVNVVNVLVTVRDRKGELIRNLNKEDFTVEEDGRPVELKYFSRESDLPLTLGLLVDTSGSMNRYIDQERLASHKFFDQVLREDKDQAFLIHFDYEVELLRDLTSSKKLLHQALEELAPAAPPRLQRRDAGDPGRPRMHGGTLLFDGVLLACDELMRKQQGRKALIVFSDGEDTGSRSSLADAIAAAQRADTLVYTVLYSSGDIGRAGFGGRGMGRRGRYPMADRNSGKKVMERLARETGGGFFEVKNKPLDEIYRQIEDELRSEYSLGYTPPNLGPGFRAINVKVSDKSYVVQARNGYYAAK